MKQIKIQQVILLIVIAGIIAVYFVFLKNQVQQPIVNQPSPSGIQVTDVKSIVDVKFLEDSLLVIAVELNEPSTELYDDQGEAKMMVELTWEIDESENEDFGLYKIYRSTNNNFEESFTIPIVEIFDKSRRTHFDLVSAGTFYYRLVVIDTGGLRASSNVVTAKP